MRNVTESLLGGKSLLFALFTVLAVSAFGQQFDNTVRREGFVIGIGVGGGVISIADSDAENPFDEAQGGISFPNLKIGAMLNERTALLVTFPGLMYEYEGKDRSFDAVMPTLQYWVSDRWWINGGIGLATDFPAFYEVDDFEDEDWNFGCAVAASTGYEIYQRDNFTIDLQSKVLMGQVSLDDDRHRDGVAFSVGIGFNWY
jgi:hypothetical protein